MHKTPNHHDADELAVMDLAKHKEIKTQSPFGISRIQRILKWSYNRAARTCDRLIDKGELVRCDDTRPELMIFTHQPKLEN